MRASPPRPVWHIRNMEGLLGLLVSCQARIPVFVVSYESSPETVLDTSLNFCSFWAAFWCVCVCEAMDIPGLCPWVHLLFLDVCMLFLKWASRSPDLKDGQGRADRLRNCQTADQTLCRKQVWFRWNSDFELLLNYNPTFHKTLFL